jgi:hypothetical protein|tara:strand:+ start:47 stop:343 length:297 start_codon:yes stop_codon:yes gene_type:complete
MKDISTRKRVKKAKTSDGGQIKVKYNKDGTIKKTVRRDASGKLAGMGKRKTGKKTVLPKGGNIKTTKKDRKERNISYSKYREGGSNNASYSYQDFLDL